MQPNKNSLSEYSYNLPPERIAQHPLVQRDASKLLIYEDGEIEENTFSNLANFLSEDSFLVFNNTKVIHARMLFDIGKNKPIEIFCLEPVAPFSQQELAMNVQQSCIWRCFVGNAKNWNENILLEKTLEIENEKVIVRAKKVEKEKDSFLIEFNWSGNFSFGKILEAIGLLPLPPYIEHKADDADEERYQTIYAQQNGAVAAPTAGLHFTKNVFDDLGKKKIEVGYVTLHVGAGTFLPMKSDNVLEHAMHKENILVEQKLVEQLKSKNEIVAVGTTSLRTLESLYWIGFRLIQKEKNPFFVPQFYALENQHLQISKADSMQAILNYLQENNLSKIEAATQIVCLPSYQFKMVKRVITNFHQPKSTLLLLIAAFVGDDWKQIYNFALANNFRFLSYGDSSLLTLRTSF